MNNFKKKRSGTLKFAAMVLILSIFGGMLSIGAFATTWLPVSNVASGNIKTATFTPSKPDDTKVGTFDETATAIAVTVNSTAIGVAQDTYAYGLGAYLRQTSGAPADGTTFKIVGWSDGGSSVVTPLSKPLPLRVLLDGNVIADIREGTITGVHSAFKLYIQSSAPTSNCSLKFAEFSSGDKTKQPFYPGFQEPLYYTNLTDSSAVLNSKAHKDDKVYMKVQKLNAALPTEETVIKTATSKWIASGDMDSIQLLDLKPDSKLCVYIILKRGNATSRLISFPLVTKKSMPSDTIPAYISAPTLKWSADSSIGFTCTGTAGDRLYMVKRLAGEPAPANSAAIKSELHYSWGLCEYPRTYSVMMLPPDTAYKFYFTIERGLTLSDITVLDVKTKTVDAWEQEMKATEKKDTKKK